MKYFPARKWGDWSEIEVWFIRVWKVRFDSKTDWNSASWTAGTSSIIEWFQWLAVICDKELLESCLDSFAAADHSPKGPQLYQVRQLYQRRKAGSRGATINTPPPDRSEPPATPDEINEIIRKGKEALGQSPPLSGRKWRL